MNQVVRNVMRMLDEKGIEYRMSEHKEVKTSEEAAAVRGVELRQLMQTYTPPAPRVTSSKPKPTPPPPPPPEPETKVIEIIRANKLSEVEFEEMPAESSNASQ